MIELSGQVYSAQFVIDTLQPFLTQERFSKIKQVASWRIENIVTVLENIYDRGNVSAVIRSGEALGFYKFIMVESKIQKFKAANRVTQGADKWIDAQHVSSSKNTLMGLKDQGFAIYSTALSSQAIDIADVPFDKKIAFVLGNEKDGVSAEALSCSDGNFLIPTTGFSQSFNISVAAAVVFYHAFRAQKKTQDLDVELQAKYMIASLSSAEKILREASQ